MRVSPLNLISTPVAVLNSLGLNLRIGLSSEDPMVGRHPTEPYEAYLSVYSPEGVLTGRTHLGRIPPDRRRFFDISSITRQSVSGLDHLVVAHRVPSRLLPPGSNPEDEIELTSEPDYSVFRSLVEYSFPDGGNGSVIYETPPRLNANPGGPGSPSTLTFSCQTVISQEVNTHIILINYSVNRSYSHIATFNFALHSDSGEMVASERVDVGPFSVSVIDMAEIVPGRLVERHRDPSDGLSSFTLVGYCDDAVLLALFVNTTPSLRAVSVEHTHPPQTYILPIDPNYRRAVKKDAESAWKSILAADGRR